MSAAICSSETPYSSASCPTASRARPARAISSTIRPAVELSPWNVPVSRFKATVSLEKLRKITCSGTRMAASSRSLRALSVWWSDMPRRLSTR